MPIISKAGLVTEDANTLQGMAPATTPTPNSVPITNNEGAIPDGFTPKVHEHTDLVALNRITEAELVGEETVGKPQWNGETWPGDHEHANKALLDSYNQTNANLADAVTKKHAHTALEALNLITKADDVGEGENLEVGLPLWNGEGWPGDHEHSNKALLDTYNQTNANLADAVTKRHAHTDLNATNLLTEATPVGEETTGDPLWNGEPWPNSHNHTNKIDLDKITSDEAGLPLWNGDAWPGGGSGGATAVADIDLMPYALRSYTNDTWTTVYTNSGTTMKALYFMSILNRGESAGTCGIRIVDANDTVIYNILPDGQEILGYSGWENAFSVFGVKAGHKVQYKASISATECLLSIGDLSQGDAASTIIDSGSAETWVDLYDNTGKSKKRIVLVSARNMSSNAGNITMRVTKVEGEVESTLYHLTPPMTLAGGGNCGVDNHTGRFILPADHKLQVTSELSGMQAFVTLVDNVPSA